MLVLILLITPVYSISINNKSNLILRVKFSGLFNSGEFILSPKDEKIIKIIGIHFSGKGSSSTLAAFIKLNIASNRKHREMEHIIELDREDRENLSCNILACIGKLTINNALSVSLAKE